MNAPGTDRAGEPVHVSKEAAVPASRRGEQGVAMITVMLLGMVLTLVLVAAMGFAVNSQPLARRDQDWNAALAAAQAGVEDYRYRLQQDDNYYPKVTPYRWSNTNPPSPTNPAISGWQTVPGPASEARFHYDVDATQFGSQGMLVVISSGRVRNVTRTVRVTLRRRNFLDYLYLTDYESLDPQSGYYSNPSAAETSCSRYWWQGRPTNPCVRISFVTGDQINGPLHTNDTISVNGSPRFNDDATTGWSGTMSCPSNPSYTYRWYGLSGCADTPVFQSGDPRTAAILALPTSNTALKAQTDPSIGNTGCLFTGPTRITLKDGGSSGLMDVVSPLTPPGGNCQPGLNRPLPANGVVYVQNVPSPPSIVCQLATNAVGYPINNDTTDYNTCDGDAFVSGTLRGQLTIASEHNVVVVGDTTYATGTAGTDLLGLVANQFVQVYHPVNSSGTNLSDSRLPRVPFTNPVIHAALLAIGHSFIVQNYNQGAQLGTLTVSGAIAQKWRGPVGTSGGSGTGYLKSYNYDGRLAFAAPPHALDLADAEFEIKVWAEIRNPSSLPV